MSGDWLEGPGGSGPPAGGGDRAGRLVAALARTPFGRGEWGRAMLAELDEVAGGRARWRFALGAARAMLLPVRGARLLLAAVAVAAAITLHLLVFPAVPIAIEAVVFGSLALCAWAALNAPDEHQAVTAASGIGQVAALAVVAACPVLAMRLLGHAARTGGRHDWAMVGIFAAELATCVLLLIRRPEPLGAGRFSGVFGLAAALAAGAVFAAAQPAGGESDDFVLNAAVFATGFGAPLAAGVLAALSGGRGGGAGRRLRAAVGEVAWGYLLTAPVVFAAVMLVTTPAGSPRRPAIRASSRSRTARAPPACLPGSLRTTLAALS